MSTPVSDLDELLRGMRPVLHEGVYAYACLPHASDVQALEAVVTVHEAEGVTVVVDEAKAMAAGMPVLFRAAWITLEVHSDLQAVGLTAAFATALAGAGIGCNVVAGAFHDHLFVPVEQRDAAMAALLALQRNAAPS